MCVCMYIYIYMHALPPKDLPFLLVECQIEDISVDKCFVQMLQSNGLHYFISQLYPAFFSLNLKNYVLHMLRQQLPSACPQISVAMPVLIVRRTNVNTKQRASHLGELVQTQAFLDELPSLINDLGSCLDAIFFPHGSSWVVNFTQIGACQTYLPLTLTRFFWWTTMSCRTPGTLAL